MLGGCYLGGMTTGWEGDDARGVGEMFGVFKWEEGAAVEGEGDLDLGLVGNSIYDGAAG